MKLQLKIFNGGHVQFIYDDAHARLIQSASRAETRRVSNVEPDPAGGWSATMLDGSGTVLGPFALRQTALDAEVEYLNRVLFGR